MEGERTSFASAAHPQTPSYSAILLTHSTLLTLWERVGLVFLPSHPGLPTLTSRHPRASSSSTTPSFFFSLQPPLTTHPSVPLQVVAAIPSTPPSSLPSSHYTLSLSLSTSPMYTLLFLHPISQICPGLVSRTMRANPYRPRAPNHECVCLFVRTRAHRCTHRQVSAFLDIARAMRCTSLENEILS